MDFVKNQWNTLSTKVSGVFSGNEQPTTAMGELQQSTIGGRRLRKSLRRKTKGKAKRKYKSRRRSKK